MQPCCSATDSAAASPPMASPSPSAALPAAAFLRQRRPVVAFDPWSLAIGGDLHRHVDVVLQRGRRQARHEGRGRPVPPSALVLVVHSHFRQVLPASSTPPASAASTASSRASSIRQGRVQVGGSWAQARTPLLCFSIAQLQSWISRPWISRSSTPPSSRRCPVTGRSGNASHLTTCYCGRGNVNEANEACLCRCAARRIGVARLRRRRAPRQVRCSPTDAGRLRRPTGRPGVLTGEMADAMRRFGATSPILIDVTTGGTTPNRVAAG